MNSNDGIPSIHPDNRVWHPLTSTVAYSLLMAVTLIPDSPRNLLFEDIIYFLRMWEVHREKTINEASLPSPALDIQARAINIDNLAEGLRCLADLIQNPSLPTH